MSSLIEQAQLRRQQVQLVGWSLGAAVAMIVLLKLTAFTTREALALFDTIVSPGFPHGVDKQAPTFTNGDVAMLDKVQPLVVEMTNELERWVATAAHGGQEELEGATSVLAGFRGCESAVGNLQENLAKARSLSNVAGLRSWELEKRQSQLKATQGDIDLTFAEVLAFGRLNFKEHTIHEEEMIALDAKGELLSNPERERRHKALQYMFEERMTALDPDAQEVLARTDEITARLDAGVSSEDAHEMARMHIAPSCSTLNTSCHYGEEVSTDTIVQIVQEEILALATRGIASEGGCISVGEGTSIIGAQLERYAADRTGKPDYAMSQGGGRIVRRMTSATYEPKDESYGYFERLRNFGRESGQKSLNEPEAAISPVSGPGRCWPMKGASGRLTIQLAEVVHVETVSIEHEPRTILPNAAISAVKGFSVIGYHEGVVPGGTTIGDVLVANEEYRLDGSAIQYFPVAEEHVEKEYEFITLEVETNHGEDAYTCLYRFRVHGFPP